MALVISCGLTVVAQTPQFNIIKPSTTGVPGEEVRVMKFDPAGNLWVAGRFYFWGEAALAMLSADQLDYQPLPGGGFDTGAWKVWSSVHHPIPSPYINDMVFGAGGVIWIASDGGLTRFDPAAPTERAEVVHLHSGQLALDPQRRPLARVGQSRQPVANQCQRAVVKRRAVSVQSHLQRVDAVSGGPGITVEPRRGRM